MTDARIFAYKARIRVSEQQDALLVAWAELHGTAERQFAQPLLRGEKIATSHPAYKNIRDSLFLSDRNANAALIGAQGKIDSAKEGEKRHALSAHFLSLKRTRILQKMTKLSTAEQKSVEEDVAFLQDLVAAMPCANRAQSGSERVHGQ
jgi:hypothetical protein